MTATLLSTAGGASSLPALLGAALAAVLIFRYLKQTVLRGALPPTLEGVPLVGGVVKFARGPMKLMAEGYAKYGEVFTVPVLHKRVTFLLGPHASPHFFKANDDEMSQKEVYEFNVPTFGPGVVFDVDHKTRAEQFRFFGDALKSSRLASYVPHFVSEARAYFAQWGDEGVVDLKDALAELIILTASRTLMGREVREHMFSRVAALFHDLDAGMLPISVLFPYAPIAPHRARDAARAELARVFAAVIAARRAAAKEGGGATPPEDDILQSFIDARYSPNVHGGRALTDGEITGLLIACLFAGQHTSSITSSWTGYLMLTHKEATYAPAVEEQARLLAKHGDTLDISVLGEMETLHANITEAIRLFPPLIMLLRLAKKPFAVQTSSGQTFTVPAGDMVFASPAFSHRLPHVFPRADEYEPARFGPERAEDKKGEPFSFIGFGGGRHGCMGTNFAYYQIKAIWAVLLREFELEMVDPLPEPDYDSLVVGPKSARVRYRRRKLAPATS